MASSNLILLSLLAAAIGAEIGQRRNLSEITYEFRSCDTTGRLGPSFQTCQDYYRDRDSLIDRRHVLFPFEDGNYLGAQGFQVPSAGNYNITLAGASGGRGLCSVLQGGFGYERTVRVFLPSDVDLLVVVGQKGREPCEFIPTFHPDYSTFCVNRPMFNSEIDNCTNAWNATFQTNPDFYAVFGGAGGGGASMVRVRNRTSRIFEQFPIVIAPGGAGTPALVNYSIIDEIDSDSPSNIFFSSSQFSYQTFMNGQSRLSDSQYITVGTSGFRIIMTEISMSAGTGGGYSVGTRPLRDQDGQALRSPQNFAVGGVDCLQFLDIFIAEIPFSGAFGGFGGGGGACGGGGAGAGYTGGHILGRGLTIPGGGGFSYVGNIFSKFPTFELSKRTLATIGDGYVDIVLSDCGCVHECIVYSAEKEFACVCPNGTSIAPDLQDCFQENELMVEMADAISHSNGVYIRQLALNTSVRLLSVRADIQVFSMTATRGQPVVAQSERCFLAFIGETSTPILISNVVSGQGRANSLSLVQFDSQGNISISRSTNILDTSVTVTGIFLVSSSNCSLGDGTITANVSIQESHLKSEGRVSLCSNTSTDQAFCSFFSELLTEETMHGLGTGAIVGSALSALVAVVLIIVLIVAMVATCYRCNRSNSGKMHHQMTGKLNTVGSDSLQSNNAYVRYEMQSVKVLVDAATGPHYDTVHIESDKARNDGAAFVNDQDVELCYGVSAPQTDFASFNKQRSNTLVKEWYYPRSNLTYMRELGEGQFGKVLLMKAKDIAGYKGKIPVAVKTLTSRDPEVIRKFTEEADLMKKFSHPNIVSLLGFTTEEEDEDSAPLIILEYMPYGDLHGFLIKHRPDDKGHSFLKKLHFYTFAYDVGKGLEFLSQQKYVHRDLAARNCLVNAPDDLCELIYRCLRHNKEDRPSIASIMQSPVFDIVKNRPPLNVRAEVDYLDNSPPQRI